MARPKASSMRDEAIRSSVAFDGANIWVTDNASGSGHKLRASDGVVLEYLQCGNAIRPACAFDGANVWVANNGSNNVTKLRASDGAVQGTFSVGHESDRGRL